MFWSRYPHTKLIRVRVLRSRGAERDLAIFPMPVSIPSPEVIHSDSTVIPLPGYGKAMIFEWTGSDSERHLVDI